MIKLLIHICKYQSDVARIRAEATPVTILIAPHTISISAAPNSSPHESSLIYKPGPPADKLEVAVEAMFYATETAALVFKFWFATA